MICISSRTRPGASGQPARRPLPFADKGSKCPKQVATSPDIAAHCLAVHWRPSKGAPASRPARPPSPSRSELVVVCCLCLLFFSERAADAKARGSALEPAWVAEGRESVEVRGEGESEQPGAPEYNITLHYVINI